MGHEKPCDLEADAKSHEGRLHVDDSLAVPAHPTLTVWHDE